MGRQPGALTLSEDDRRVLAVWAADCAERTLPLFEARAPTDRRPRDAIDGLRAFARGQMRIGQVRALAASVAHMAAHARGVVYAVRAAGLAAPDDPAAAAREVRWQLGHASPAVREALRRLPPPARSSGALGALVDDLHTRLTARGKDEP